MCSTECSERLLLLFTSAQLGSLLRLILASTWPSDSSLGEQNAPPNHPSFLLQHHCPEKLPQQPPALTPESGCPMSVPGAWAAGWPRTYPKPVSYQRPGARLSVAGHAHIPPPTTAQGHLRV